MGNKGHPARRIDACMNPLVQWINEQGQYRTLASCCGHGKYRPTIVVLNQERGYVLEWFTGILLNRYCKNGRVNRRFYARDDQGFYRLIGLPSEFYKMPGEVKA